MENLMFVSLDVGGQSFKMLRSTVMKYPGNLIAEVLTGKTCKDCVVVENNYFFDRNPLYFEVILDFMRSGKVFIKKNLNQEQMKEEIKFWKMDTYMNVDFNRQDKHFFVRSVHSSSMSKYTDPPIQNQPTLIMNEEVQPTLIMNEEVQPTLIMNEEVQPTLIMNEEIQPTLLMNEEVQPTLIMNEEVQPKLSREGSTDTQPLEEIESEHKHPSAFDISKPKISEPPYSVRNTKKPTILTNDLLSSLISEPEEPKRLNHPTPKPIFAKQPPIPQEEHKISSHFPDLITNPKFPLKPIVPVPKQSPNKKERVLPWQSQTPTKSPASKQAKKSMTRPAKKQKLIESQESVGSAILNESYESSFIDDYELEDQLLLSSGEDQFLGESDSEAEYQPRKRIAKKSTKTSAKTTPKSRKRKGSD